MNKNNSQQPSVTTEIQIARLAYIGASIAILGDDTRIAPKCS
ncbi:hypothetical protein BFZC1_14763 [Lysinibacillus fusiformis ZC1]|nr:hypothetical protein BFZC1_14763 [Lysinibacillus fusiformis ZC1]EKU44932.1 hypothetical protein C518_0538 [Lysinibacillus fusiformis ZB2]